MAVSMARHIRSDLYREVYREALKQKFVPGVLRNSHISLTCPKCEHRSIISATGNAFGHNGKNTISELRSHGFIWRGRGGAHTAPYFNREALARRKLDELEAQDDLQHDRNHGL